jgi:hypothetical protein
VSTVARSPRGFLTAYREVNGHAARLSDAWRQRREAFIARHLAQLEQRGEPILGADGKPTSPCPDHVGFLPQTFATLICPV